MLRGDLDSIVHKALRKEPQSRYLGVEAFDADIANFLANRPVQASGSRRIYRAVKFVQRNRLMLGVICGAMLAQCARRRWPRPSAMARARRWRC